MGGVSNYCDSPKPRNYRSPLANLERTIDESDNRFNLYQKLGYARMKTSYLVAFCTALVLIGLSLASGPLIGLSLTTEQESDFNPSTGSFEASVVETPDIVIVKQARYGADVSHIHAPPVELYISNITGQPSVTYKLIYNDIGYSTSTVWFLNPSMSGGYDLKFASKTVASDRFDKNTYHGKLEVVVRDNTGEWTLVETDITMKVQK